MDELITRVLVVDDEATIREVLTDFLIVEGYDVVTACDGQEAIDVLSVDRFDAVLLDLKMPRAHGIEVLRYLSQHHPETVSIMMTGYGTVETAIQAMKQGAYDYILKPFKVQEVIRLLERGLAQQRLKQENIQLKQAVSLYELSEKMSNSLELATIFDLLIEAARQEVQADGVAVWLKQQDGDAFECTRRWHRLDLDGAQIEATQNLQWTQLQQAHARGDELVFRGQDARALMGPLEAGYSPSLMCIPLEIKGQTHGYFFAFAFDEEQAFKKGTRKFFSVLCHRASAALENAWLYRDLQYTFKQTIQAFANLLEDKDPYTRGHSERVSRYAQMIARGLGWSEAQVAHVADCALMHDIGKLGIRYEDLNKVEPLSDAEYEMFKSHTTRGKWILEPIAFLHHLIPGVYHHHERWDGRGYPLGLSGEDIPIDARILAIADTYDAMTSHRAYRRALPHDVAIREIKAFAGAQFDPQLVDIFVEAIERDRAGYQSKAHRWNALLDSPPRVQRQQRAEDVALGE